MNGAFAGKTIVLGVSGSISAYKAADLCSKLVQEGARVLPILTRGALRFVQAPTFWGLSSEPVSTDVWDEPFGPSEIAHLRYAELADAFVVAPASANFLARLTAGLCDDMLTAALVANATKPVYLAPAMNTDMWQNAATQANRQTLEKRGYHFIDPGVGRLAEGVVGAGRLAEPSEIVALLKEALFLTPIFAGRKVLVTAGPTREPLDPVRYLSNRSSGKMGYAIAERAAARGASVVLVSGPTNLPAPPGVERIAVITAAEMLQAAQKHSDADVIIAAAAVADYTPAQIAAQKIKKSSENALTLTLVPTPDILATLGAAKRPGQILVGFAAETENILENARRKLAAKNLDMIVLNDVTQTGAGFDTDTNIVTLLTLNAKPVSLPMLSKHAVADALLERVQAILLKPQI